MANAYAIVITCYALALPAAMWLLRPPVVGARRWRPRHRAAWAGPGGRSR